MSRRSQRILELLISCILNFFLLIYRSIVIIKTLIFDFQITFHI